MLVRLFPRHVLYVLTAATLILAACGGGPAPEPTADVNAINTAAVASAMAQISEQLTQTALAAPTDTPPPTNTAMPLATLAVPTTDGSAQPTADDALPTLSFQNVTPGTNTTPLAGFTPVSGSPVAPVNTTAPLGDDCHNSQYVADVTIPDNSVLERGVNFQKVWRVQNTGTCTWDEGYTLAFVAGDQALDPENYVIERADEFVAGGETVDIGVNLTAPTTPGMYSATWRMQTDNGVFFGTMLTVVIEVR
jgi:hypothetical protein